ncbi:MAG: ubiquinone/menaquinone biosynthesis methyltransferase [Lentisphaeria bacterium]
MDQNQKNCFFNKISKRYNLTNKLMSFGFDMLWRRKCAKIVPLGNILDLACGNGDFLKLIVNDQRKCFGLDPAKKMLNLAKRTVPNGHFICGVAENIPLENNMFDAVTIVFGVRNFQNIEIALKEIYRLLRPQGELIILELRQKKSYISPLSKFYIKNILPYFGAIFGGHFQAYKYLSKSVIEFSELNFEHLLESNGFNITENKYFFPGVCQLIKLKKV